MAARGVRLQLIKQSQLFINTILLGTGLVATLWRAFVVCVLCGLLWTVMLLFDVSVAIAFGEQLFHIQYIVDLGIIGLFFYFARLIILQRDYY